MNALAKHLLETLQTLPESDAQEVLDFAEFLRQRRLKGNSSGKPLADFFGSLANSPHFQGDPVQIQRALRDEWD
ncbi:DUF2281 domain-containing protein [Methylomagnum sp.]